MKKIIIVVIAVVILGAAAYAYFGREKDNGTTFRFVAIEKGDVEAVVSTTGTLSAVKTVQVGTQISGLIIKLYVDFNDKVTQGQIVAELDTTLLETQIKDAEATLERNQAQLRQALRDFDRISSLHKQGISADADFNTVQYNLDVARAQLKSSEASLTRARQNLAYATIKAPVSGTVVSRDVDVGQTVAASLSAPRLFIIANDLSEMQILAPVDESDIGQIKDGQIVRFTVKTYPDKKFSGTVKQVRLQSTVEQNVVNYTVAISVANPDGLLKPGMTATVEFIVGSAKDVFKIANAALRFRPSDTVIAEVRERMQKERAANLAAKGGENTQRGEMGNAPTGQQGEAARPMAGGMPGGGGNGAPGAMGGGMGFPGGGNRTAGNGRSGRPDFTLLYYLDATGKITATPARIGITDGQFTEIKGRSIQAGMQIVAGMTQKASTTATNPFQGTQQTERRGPPGGM